ncbi:MAG: phytanoyl-CoA dioxygenase family protein [Capsulimonadaceae bacterium]|nr:phytanoyl-CoA dioxygenase family protein [Capsulimonadaceae bacterium]
MADRELKVLSQKEVDFYRHYGYLKGFPIFNQYEVAENELGFQDLCRQLEPGESPSVIKGWERTSAFIYAIATNHKVLDIVQDLVGPDLLLWSTHFLCKFSGEGSQTPWHQDARYWPLAPHETVTVWLAFDDCDAENSGLVVIPASHTIGIQGSDNASSPVSRARENEFQEEDAVVLDLKLGHIAIYDDNLIHATLPNRSQRRRAGLIMRYCTPRVKCDLTQWPGFCSTVVRGSDPFKHNPSWDPSDIYMAAS